MKAPSKVKVTRPDPETGEIVEELVSANRFRRKRDSRGIAPETCAQILSGAQPALLWEGSVDSPVEPGDEIKLSNRCSIEIWRVVRSKETGDHLVRPQDYIVKDGKARLLRRVPQMYEPPELDKYGTPQPVDQVAIDKATEDGNYTSSQGQAVTDAGEAIPHDYQNALTQEAEQANALMIAARRRQSEGLHKEMRLREETKPKTAKVVARHLRSINRSLKDAG